MSLILNNCENELLGNGMCSRASVTDVCLWKRAHFTIHSDSWDYSCTQPHPQTMCHHLSPVVSSITCHSSRWDNWPSCKLSLYNSRVGLEMHFTQMKKKINSVADFSPPQNPFSGRKRFFNSVHVVSWLSKDLLSAGGPYSTLTSDGRKTLSQGCCGTHSRAAPHWDVGDTQWTFFHGILCDKCHLCFCTTPAQTVLWLNAILTTEIPQMEPQGWNHSCH